MTPAMAAPRPPGDAALPSERAAFEIDLQRWIIAVRLATRDFVGLGRPYEVHLTVRPQASPVTEISQLGFDLLPLYGSHLICVKDLKPLDRTRVDARFVPLQMAPVSQVAALQGIGVEDVLVGLNGDDVLIAPSHGLTPLRKRILGACEAVRLRGAGVASLRFVRMDSLVQVDPTRGVTHGTVLKTLDCLQRTYADLKLTYDKLLSRNRTMVTQRLARHKKLLGFCVHKTKAITEAVHRDERYKFAMKFQAWFAAMAEPSACDDEDEDMDDGEGLDDDGEDVERRLDLTVESIFPADDPQLQQPVQPRPTDVDLRWRDILSPQEMKWLPQAHEVLTKFIEGLVDGFTSDGFWISEIASRSRSIAERLVTTYARKLQSTSTANNATIRKEFMQHARMLRSNIINPNNKQLRRDVLSGSISVTTLCDMTSEQLAPESLQADRQRRYEKHAKEITITAPSGSVLVKTKHGLKELSLGDAPSGLPSSTDAADPSIPHVPMTTMPHATDDASGKLRSIDVDKEEGVSALGNPSSETEQVRAARTSGAKNKLKRTDVVAFNPITAKYTPDEAKAFLSAMFDPGQDVEGTIRQLQSTIHSTPLATMSNEFMLAPGVKLYRDVLTAQTHGGTIQFRARVRLLHWFFQYDASSDRDATMSALYQLLKALEECRRLFGRLLDELQHQCHYPQPEHNRDARRRAIDVLVREGMKVHHYPIQHSSNNDSPMIRADAQIDGITVVSELQSDIISARNMAAHSVADFMNNLVAIRNSRHIYPSDDVQAIIQENHPNHDTHHFEQSYPEAEVYDEERKNVPLEEDSYIVSNERKRPLEVSVEENRDVEPDKSRRRTTANNNSAEPRPDRPAFFKDVKGEERLPPRDPEEEERKEKNQVEAYQELVRFLFRSRQDVMAGIQLDWNHEILEKEVALNSRLKFVRKITRSPNSGSFVCILAGLEGILNITNTSKSLDEASAHVTNTFTRWLDGIYGDWSTLVDTYIAIMRRKHIQRVPQADASLSAANETRKDRAASSFVQDDEKPKGALSEYLIRIRTQVAVRQVCLNMKMAKRAAGEEFRDLLEWIKKVREESTLVGKPTAKGLSSAGRSSPVQSGAIAAGARPSSDHAKTGQTPAPAKAPTRVSNMIVCSDDSGDDDSDDFGGGYSDDDDDWHPQLKSEEPSEASTRDERHSRGRVEDILNHPYPIASESGDGDDAKFRAIIRSLFTPEDELCTGISGIRGALKYQGHHNTRIVPNVQASIRLELLRGETFNVYASVNDVVHFKATARSKPEACDKAVEGLLEELDKIRQIWVELMHFYHMKELGNHNPMDSFNALRLANIVKIETVVEPPPPTKGLNRMVEAKTAAKLHCVMYFGEHAVYRVDGETEHEVHALATSRALSFLVDLIDKGLDPTPTDVQDKQFAPMQDLDWSCSIKVDVFGDRYRRVEYFADGRWAIPGRVPEASHGISWPKQLTLIQIGRAPMPKFEQEFVSSNDPNIFFFRIEAPFENGKFVNHIAEFGHKSKYRTFVLHFEVAENRDIDVYVFPPAASVNSRNNLYWSQKIMPREISDLKGIYGYATRRRRRNW